MELPFNADYSGSQTITANDAPYQVPEERQVEEHVLRLQPESRGRRVRWANNTVDNENMNKKKSKVCCIFHKAKRFDESSSESDSDSDSSSCSRNAYERA
ncbi:protein phosphatase inhibitor [Schizosaccharomyces octosporus yFS286]|uniref:Type 1 phosphatases regulator n=1 Tax=Schizosaccharomyces octosporus (strain yFS286) TaxID=483514 RepID=S9QWN5_SCHOY|nr:protein phosphatase inhibitor [Schizosaccharomyces octosporus yFS286]EPX70720.1 protein phosphatase inhibitor [Schizosaccharomyces octosporus yFS286]